jgi:hypothetical protein
MVVVELGGGARVGGGEGGGGRGGGGVGGLDGADGHAGVLVFVLCESEGEWGCGRAGPCLIAYGCMHGRRERESPLFCIRLCVSLSLSHTRTHKQNTHNTPSFPHTITNTNVKHPPPPSPPLPVERVREEAAGALTPQIRVHQ